MGVRIPLGALTNGPFGFRRGRHALNVARGVRLPYGLLRPSGGTADARGSEPRVRNGRGSAILPLVTRLSVHWCSGTARRPVEAEVRDRHPYASLILRSGLEPGFQHGLISRTTSVQIRPPQLAGGARPGRGSYPRHPRCDSWTRNCRPSTQTGKAARSRAWRLCGFDSRLGH